MSGLDEALAGVTEWLGDNILIDTVRITLPATGEPVLNPTTGQLEYPDPAVLYEGPGAIQSAASRPLTMDPTGNLPWLQETRSSYTLLTPLSAPIAPKDATVTVTAVHDPARTGLIGRTWMCSDPSQSGTVEVVRQTPLDQMLRANP